jgi:hypothetical protein
MLFESVVLPGVMVKSRIKRCIISKKIHVETWREKIISRRLCRTQEIEIILIRIRIIVNDILTRRIHNLVCMCIPFGKRKGERHALRVMTACFACLLSV